MQDGAKRSIDAKAHGATAQTGSGETHLSVPAKSSAAHEAEPPQAVADLFRYAAPPTAQKGETALVSLEDWREAILESVAAYDPHADLNFLAAAFDFGREAHRSQFRHSGEPYYFHPAAVAGILTELRADPATVVTALLHDTIEDTDVKAEDVRRAFGPEIEGLVDGVTKLTRIELKSEESKAAENFRKLIVAMAKDVRVLLVKLADRLHNMRTLHHIARPAKRRRIALETMEIFAPLAGRIGVQTFREELEDLAFAELNPEASLTLQEKLNALRREAGDAIVEIALTLREQLAQHGVDADVTSREKRPYSIWRKMADKNLVFQELADIFGFRILVERPEDCYQALGVIHQQWAFLPGRFKDYISTPKPNNYRSLHTTVWGPRRGDHMQRIEIQIRTREMQDTAERGVAAHWRYKDPGAATGGGVEINQPNVPGSHDPYKWLQGVVKMLEHGDDAEEFLEHTKLELFQDQVFCFTPKGRLIALPRGATPVDFAYALHTDVGDTCVGARVNGRTMPLRTSLQNGDMVEILRSMDASPPINWESLVVTGRARSAIRRHIKRIAQEERVKLGREIASAAFAEEGEAFSDKAVAQGLKRLEVATVEDVYEQLGKGTLTAKNLLKAVFPGVTWRRLLAPVRPGQKANKSENDGGGAAIAITGLTPGAALHLAPCCCPLPGDRIVGITTPGKGVVVHTIDCETLAAEDPPQNLWLDLKWRNNASDMITSVARLALTSRNAPGALGEVTTVVARYHGNISNIRMTSRTVDFFDMALDVEVSDVRHLTEIMAALRASASVIRLERVRG